MFFAHIQEFSLLYLVILVFDSKSFPQIPKHLWTVFFEFELSWEILSVEKWKKKLSEGFKLDVKSAARLTVESYIRTVITMWLRYIAWYQQRQQKWSKLPPNSDQPNMINYLNHKTAVVWARNAKVHFRTPTGTLIVFLCAPMKVHHFEFTFPPSSFILSLHTEQQKSFLTMETALSLDKTYSVALPNSIWLSLFTTWIPQWIKGLLKAPQLFPPSI